MKAQYTQRLEKIEEILMAALPPAPGGSWLETTFDPLPGKPDPALVASLTEPGRELVIRGGKRWRPLLMTLACEALGGGDRALSLTPLVEFPHNASLIHDDIEDRSDLRRGKPAIHCIYGEDTAINSGCFMYFLPLSVLDRWEGTVEEKYRIQRTWGEHLRRLHLGQAMDIAWHRNPAIVPALDQYDLMCRMKTGVLASLSAVLGAYAAGEAENTARTLGTAAEDLGVGFQILDDVKNLTTGNPGKKRGDDIVEGKKSLPVLLFLHRHPARIEFVKSCFTAARASGCEAHEVEALIAELESSGAIEEARLKGLALVKGSGEAIRTMKTPGNPQTEEAWDLLADLPALLQ